ncbi:MAG: hypothetical protein MMC23_002791 [Stictis urceolatum]|nr:hypothetical protein [Stictis urceolata]
MGIANIITYHPFKGLYALAAILLGLVRLPFWLLWYAIPSLRQHPNYSLRQAVRTHIVKLVLWHNSKIQIYTPLVLEPKAKEGPNLISIPASTKAGLYQGVCQDKSIRPSTICGYWYPSPYDPSVDKGKKILLHFHGGAYVIGDCRPHESGFAGATLAKHVGKNLQVSYRLASNPNGRFPAALQDAVSAYQFLLDQGVPASDIVIGGDSAGGNLTAALLRYIATMDGVLPVPHAALLWSPWVDLEAGLDRERIWTSPNEVSDYISSGFAYWGVSSYAPPGGPVDPDSEWVSPKGHPFATETAVWIQACGLEVLYHDCLEFKEGMEKVQGNRVGWYVEPVAPHDIILVGHLTGFEKQAVKAAKAAKKWLDGL